MVQFKNVTKTYDNGRDAVSDISFVIEEGEFVFLIGPSGSGKTTLIELLIRDEKPTSGKIYIGDTEITNINRNKVYQLRRQIGVIFQDFKLVPDKTAYENVAFAMEAAGKTNQEIKEAVPYVLDIVGLADRMQAFPEQLSGGEQQRVAIARAISNNPKLLIADEPTGNLDPASAWDIVQILTKINNWGTTVIMSTHGTDIVNTLSKRVIQMEKGRVLRDDNEGGYEFQEKADVESVYALTPEDEAAELNRRKSFKINLSDKVKEEDPVPEVQNTRNRGFFSFFRRHKKRSEPISETIEEVLSNQDSNQESTIQDPNVVSESSQNIQDLDPKTLDTSSSRKSRLFISLDKEEVGQNSPIVEVAKKAKKAPKKEKNVPKYKNISVEFLHLPKRIITHLKESGISTIGKLEENQDNMSQNLEEEDIIEVKEALVDFISNQ